MPHKDPEARKAYCAAYNAKRREKARQQAAEWRAANPGRNAETARAWREKNPEKAKQSQKEYRAKNKEKVRDASRAWRERTGYNQSEKRLAYSKGQQLRTHGLTLEDYQKMLAEQGGGCAICGRTDAGVKTAPRLYVDHCHKTDIIRGLLCGPCNSMLGHARDDISILRGGVAYLEQDFSGRPVRSEKRILLGAR